MDRFALWAKIFTDTKVRYLAEVGVDRGEFAGQMILNVPCLKEYWLVDPWCELPEWDKPCNDGRRGEAFEAAQRNVDYALGRRAFEPPAVLWCRATSQDVVRNARRLPERPCFDAVYIDGDHTLRGIHHDLHAWWPLVDVGGILCGDDAVLGGQHPGFEPSMVWPMVALFAELVNCPLTLLGEGQWMIVKDSSGYRVEGETAGFGDRGVRHALGWAGRKG